MDAIAGMAPHAEVASTVHTLRLRFISAAVLLPLAFGAAWLGGIWWVILVAVFAGAMAWEWSRIVTSNRSSAAAAIIAVAGAVELTHLGTATFALMVLALGAVLATVLARGERLGWQALGVFYVGLPSLAIVWIRDEPDGLAALAWMLTLVIAVDTGAYVAGRSIGGPKLAPRISPRKTWAGLAGGIIAALLIGAIWSFLLDLPRALPLILISGVLAAVEQAGDLAESAFKRRFGVKDSSQLIPGHGGVLDRVDGLLAVSLVVGTVGWLVGGLSGWMR
jgi:phosphatidate cytidylyltransferase